jgi:hypothetical protein
MKSFGVVAALAGALLSLACPAVADDGAPERQALSDAWWTGPLLANTAATLPKGHFAGETYVYDSAVTGHYDEQGRWHKDPHQDGYGSQTFLTYGVTDRFTAAAIVRFADQRIGKGQNSSGVGLGDVTLFGQYKLHQFHEGSWVPTISVALGETLPTGRFQNLDRPANGFGGGAYTTQASLYTQTYFWAPTGRILRARFDLTYFNSFQTRIEGMSVFGTPAGFRGDAKPGDGVLTNLAFEYNASRHWVAAIDFADAQYANTWVRGTAPAPGGGRAPFRGDSGWSDQRFIAPALEYNWNGNVGLIFGARLFVAGRNAGGGATPVAALNYAF